MQNRKRIRQAAACYTKIETAEAVGKKDRAWVVDGKPVVLEVLVPVVFEEDKVEVLEVEVLEAPVPVALVEDRVEVLEAPVPEVFEEDKAEARVALVEDKAVAREEVPAEVLEVPVALVEDRTDNRENREADMKQALASAVLAGAPAYV